MRKFLILMFCALSFEVSAMEKKTTFDKDLFKKAQSEGKIVVVSSWIKYCSSCAGQMKILQKAEKDFENIKYFSFEVTNQEISNFFKVEYQTTLLIFKNNEEVYRSIGETSKEKIYQAIKSSISKKLSISLNSNVLIGS